MPETYPNDAALLALTQDDATGVEYIPTGQSPYVISYRKMLYRLLRASERANDLRVYPMGGRMVGVRPGRCFVGQQSRLVNHMGPIELEADASSHLYIDQDGLVAVSTTGLPADRASFIPLAQVVTVGDTLTQLVDLRGEAIMQAQTAALAGITATTSEINQALDGIDPGVTAANLTILTAGTQSTADSQHRHLSTIQDIDGPANVSFANFSASPAATIGLELAMPLVLPDVTRLYVDRATGFLQQSHLGNTYHLVGVTTLSWARQGALTSPLVGELAGCVPLSGQVIAVFLSVRLNTQSSDSTDGISLHAFVNGTPLTADAASLTAAAGPGFRCTDQGDGAQATLVTDGTTLVNRGDLITLDLNYITNGSISQAPTDVAALVVIKADRPE